MNTFILRILVLSLPVCCFSAVQGCGKTDPKGGSSSPAVAGVPAKAEQPVYIPPPGGIPAPRQDSEPVGEPKAAPREAGEPSQAPLGHEAMSIIQKVEQAQRQFIPLIQARAREDLEKAKRDPALTQYGKDVAKVRSDPELSDEDKAEQCRKLSLAYAAHQEAARLEGYDPRDLDRAREIGRKLAALGASGSRDAFIAAMEEAVALGTNLPAKELLDLNLAIEGALATRSRMGAGGLR